MKQSSGINAERSLLLNMKMETEIKSPMSGTVKEVEIEVGNKVQTGQVLVTIG
ncbi:MAG: biotin/lipoyl-containing protein [Candidatus Gastranaerophilaceae bacterium]